MTPRLASLTAAALVLSTATVAAASESIAVDARARAHRLEARIGMMVGGGDVGDVTGPSTGLHTSLGARLGDATAMLEYDYLGVGDSASDNVHRYGHMSRAGLTARYSLFRSRDDAPIAAEWWAEAGVGAERITWNPGGVLTRPDLALGFGAELDGRPYWKHRHPRHLGMWLGFRALVARAPATDSPAVCGGPCTMATQPSRNDVSLYFTFGVHFGR
jgi:hypothetical protein